MAVINDRLSELYQVIPQGSFKDEAEFRSYVTDENKLKEFYSILPSGSFRDEDEFVGYFGNSLKKKDFSLEALARGESLSQMFGIKPKESSAPLPPLQSTKKPVSYEETLPEEVVPTSVIRARDKKSQYLQQKQLELSDRVRKELKEEGDKLQSDYQKRAQQEGADKKTLEDELDVRLGDLVFRKQKEFQKEIDDLVSDEYQYLEKGDVKGLEKQIDEIMASGSLYDVKTSKLNRLKNSFLSQLAAMPEEYRKPISGEINDLFVKKTLFDEEGNVSMYGWKQEASKKLENIATEKQKLASAFASKYPGWSPNDVFPFTREGAPSQQEYNDYLKEFTLIDKAQTYLERVLEMPDSGKGNFATEFKKQGLDFVRDIASAGFAGVIDDIKNYKIARKIQDNEPVSPGERATFDALGVLETAASGIEGGKLGKVVAEGIPFIESMLLTGGAGIGKNVASNTLKQILKKEGARLFSKEGAKILGREVGKAGIASLEAAPLSPISYSRMFQGLTGQRVLNEKGEWMVDRATVEGKLEAATKGLATGATEYFTESLGGLAGEVGGLIRKVPGLSKFRLAKGVEDLFKITKFQGAPTEVAEELINIPLQAPIGDQPLSEVTLQDIWDTIWTTAGFTTILGAIGVPGGISNSIQRGRNYNTVNQFGRDIVSELRDAIVYKNKDAFSRAITRAEFSLRDKAPEEKQASMSALMTYAKSLATETITRENSVNEGQETDALTKPERFTIPQPGGTSLYFKNKQDFFTWLDQNGEEKLPAPNEVGYLDSNVYKAMDEWKIIKKAQQTKVVEGQKDAERIGTQTKTGSRQPQGVVEGEKGGVRVRDTTQDRVEAKPGEEVTGQDTGQDVQEPGKVVSGIKDLEQKESYDCGVCALRTVLSKYGIDTTEDQIIKETNPSEKTGVDLKAIVENAQNKGLNAEMKQDMTPDDLREAVDNDIPVIILQNGVGETKAGKSYEGNKDAHYITIKGYEGGEFIFEDPSAKGKNLRISEEDLLKRWHGYLDDGKTIANGIGIVISKPAQKATPPRVLKTKEDIDTYVNDKVTQAPAEKKRFTRMKAVVGRVMDVLSKIAPDTEVVMLENDDEVNKTLVGLGVDPGTAKYNGWYHQGKVYLNAARFKDTTPIHEAIHPIMNVMRQVAPEKYTQWADKASKEQIRLEDGTTMTYSEYVASEGDTPAMTADESLVTFLEDFIGDKIDYKKVNKTSVVEAIKRMLTDLLEFMGINPKTFAGADINLDDIQDLKQLSESLLQAFEEGRAVTTATPANPMLGPEVGGVQFLNGTAADYPITEGVQPSRDYDVKFGDVLIPKNYDIDQDGDNFIFYHYGDVKGGVVDPKFFGRNAYTTDKRTHKVSYYYVKDNQRERMVNGPVNVVTVPKHKVYPFNEDPMFFYEKAKAAFEKENPGIAFDAPRQIDAMNPMIAQAGYDMVVAKWDAFPLRAESTKPLKVDEAKTAEFASEKALGGRELVKEQIDNDLQGKASRNPELASIYYSTGVDGVLADPKLRKLIDKKLLKAYEGKTPARIQPSIDRVAIIKNTSAEIERLKALPIEAEDGATLNLDGTKYTGGGLATPITSRSPNPTQAEITPEMVADFIEASQNKIGSDIVKPGLYKFPNQAVMSIDLNAVIPREHREVGLEFGRLAGQESLFDLDTFENIKTGATGQNPVQFTDEEFREIADSLSRGELPRAVANLKALESGVSTHLGDPTTLRGPIQASKVRDVKVRAGYNLSYVKDSDLIDITTLVNDIHSKGQKVWFWVADQLGRGYYYDTVLNKEHYLDAGPSYALDPINRERGIIWASGMKLDRIQSNIKDSDYIFIISGSPIISHAFNQGVFDLLQQRIEQKGDFKKFKAATLKTSGVGDLTKLLKAHDSFESFKGSRDRKELIKLISAQETKQTPLKSLLQKYNAIINMDELRDDFYRENDFLQNDIMLVLKPESASIGSDHSTYLNDVSGGVVGVPDKVINSYDLMPDELRKVLSGRRVAQSQVIAPYGSGIRDITSVRIQPSIERPARKRVEETETRKREIGRKVVEESEMPQDIKDALLAEGIEYIPRGRRFTQAESKELVNIFGATEGGLDKLASAVYDITNDIAGDTRVVLNVYIAEQYSKQLDSATTPDERAKIRKKLANAFIFGQEYATKAGQVVEAMKKWGEILSRDPEAIIAIKKRQQTKNNEAALKDSEKDIKTVKETLDSLLNTPEFKQIIETEVNKAVDNIATKKFGATDKKKIEDFFDSLMIKDDKMFDATLGIPVAVYNGAMVAIKKAIFLGVDITNAIKQGIEYIDNWYKENYASGKIPSPEWNKTDYEIQMAEKLKPLTKKVKQVKFKLPKKAEDNIVDKLYEKMDNATKPQLRRMVRQYIDVLEAEGAVSQERFRDLFARAIGLEVLSVEDEQKIRLTGQALNNARKVGDRLVEKFNELLKETDPGKTKELEAQIKALKKEATKARHEAQKASQKLGELLSDQTSLGQVISSLIQGNLLTPISLVTNVIGNTAFLPVRGVRTMTASALDFLVARSAEVYTPLLDTKWIKAHPRIRRLIAGLPTPERVYNSYAAIRGFGAGIKMGTKEGLKQLLSGQLPDDLYAREISRGLDPIKAFKRFRDQLTGKGQAKFDRMLADFLEALPGGYTAETFFRLLNLGDKPFRKAAENARLSEIASLKGLKGNAREAFMNNPDPDSLEEAHKAGEVAVYQNDNIVSDIFKYLQRKLGNYSAADAHKSKSIIIKTLYNLFKGTQAPYVKTPVNLIVEAIEYTMAPYSYLRAFEQMARGNKRRAYDYMAKAIVGTMLVRMAIFLLEEGLLSPPPDDDEKIRQAQYTAKPGYSLNMDALARKTSGGDSSWKDGDMVLNIQRLGVFSMVLMAVSKAYKDIPRDEFKSLTWIERNVRMAPAVVGSALDQSFLVGTASGITAFTEGGPALDRWAINTAKALSAVIYPNTLAQISQVFFDDNYIREVRDMYNKEERFGKQIKNTFKDRMFMGKDLPAKVSIWGERVNRVPEGRNWPYSLFDVTKSVEYQKSSFGTRMFEFYEKYSYIDEKEAKRILPSLPSGANTVGWDDRNMTPQEVEELQMSVGRMRKAYVENLMNSAEWEAMSDEEKIDNLDKIYRDIASKVKAGMFMLDVVKKDTQLFNYLKRNDLLPIPSRSVSFKFRDKTVKLEKEEAASFYDTVQRYFVEMMNDSGADFSEDIDPGARDRLKERIDKIWRRAKDRAIGEWKSDLSE
jgi:predicted double-glycine peptidase/flagellar biosynthesis regulator FlaF